MRRCLVLMLCLARLVDASWTNCPTVCRCLWVSGRKVAECVNASLTAVPANLSSEIQVLDVSYNTISSLPAETFKSASLLNLQKLFLRSCGIQHLDSRAFSSLHILIELDLSYNNISKLSPFTFQENYRLRQLHVSHNPLQKLDDNVFVNLTFLLNVELSDCQLSHISQSTFRGVPKLNSLDLSANNLTNMALKTLEDVPSLASLSLSGNPWLCDCRLKAFMQWTVHRRLHSRSTVCAQPTALRGKPWTDVSSEDLSCTPRVHVPISVADSAGSNVTLPCRCSGNPLPDTHWVYDSRVISNSTHGVSAESKYVVSQSLVDGGRWFNLTVLAVSEGDAGLYTCVAQSYGGVQEGQVRLQVRDEPAASGIGVVAVPGTGFSLEAWSLVIGLAVGGALGLVLVASLLAYCCLRLKRRRRALGVKSIAGGKLASGEAHLPQDGHEEKFPLTTVNPVQKPPRRIDRLSVTSAGTELTEIKSSLLDGASVYQPSSVGDGDSEDHLEGRSLDSVDSNMAKSQEGLDEESVRSYLAPRAYPPDLISFPGRTQPPPQPYHAYGTLPYARSHSPLSMCSVPAVAVSRPNGYVTIPRRPRVPSWSSSGDPCLQKLHPTYDNLGPRTTADGSSLLSLNNASGGDTSWTGRVPPEGVNSRRAAENRSSVASMSSLSEKVPPPRPPPKPRKKSLDLVAGPLVEDEEDDGTEV